MVKKIIYDVRKGGFVPKKKVQVVGERISALSKSNGGKITPSNLIKDARSKNSVLHDLFEWDDTEAGKKFRLYQSRQILGSIIETVIIQHKKETIRSFFSVTSCNNKPIYVNVKKMTSKNFYRNQIIEEAKQNMERAIKLLSLIQSQE